MKWQIGIKIIGPPIDFFWGGIDLKKNLLLIKNNKQYSPYV
jgi:hypothetical protein